MAMRLCVFWLLCCSFLFGQRQPTKKCSPVTPRNRQEALMMEEASHKNGCWVRDKQTGLLIFLSDQAPNKNYKPLVLPNPPKAVPPRTYVNQQFGVDNPALYPTVVGTWRGTWCGLATDSVKLMAIGPPAHRVLVGTITTREVIMNQDVNTCEELEPRFSDNPPISVPLKNAGFDGQVLRATVTYSGQTVEYQLQLVGGKLIGPGGQPGSEPTVYVRVQEAAKTVCKRLMSYFASHTGARDGKRTGASLVNSYGFHDS
jgi:hypothetical protein